MITRKYYWIAALLFAALVVACDEWDDHNEINKPGLNENLLQAIKSQKELSTFVDLLESTGYDEVISSSKTFTVWAPDNDALASLPSEIVNNEEKLRAFVGNHISYQEYYTESGTPGLRVKMLNGKYLGWNGSSLEGVSVETSDKLAKNGVLHTIGGSIQPKENVWEVAGASAGIKQTAFMNSLTYDLFVDSLATQIGVDPATGQPIYEPGTGLVERNHFFDEVYDINNEDSVSTYIVLTDEAFDAELAKLTPYFKTITGSQDSTDSLASFHLVKDLVFRGKIEPAQLPDTLISLYGVKVPIDQSAIVETHYTSNGIVYVMNKVDFRLRDKFPPITIQGEWPDGFGRSDKNVNIHFRIRDWADRGYDLRVWDHGVAQFNVRYKLNRLYATTYKVYWKALNDFVDTTFTGTGGHLDAFQQKLVLDSRSTYAAGVPSPGALKDFGYVKVNRRRLDPVNNGIRLLGTYTHSDYKRLYLYIVSSNVTTPNTMNAIEVDYIKLVPVF